MKRVEYSLEIEDIAEYAEDREECKNLEAFFIKYYNDNLYKTCEGYNLIVAKYNILLLPPDEIYQAMKKINEVIKREIRFTDYINTIQHLDYTGIGYMMIPILRLNGVEKIYIDNLIKLLNTLVGNDEEIIKYSRKELEYIVKCYERFKQVEIDKNYFVTIKLSREDSNDMIKKYYKIYGKDKVLKLKQDIKKLAQ